MWESAVTATPTVTAPDDLGRSDPTMDGPLRSPPRTDGAGRAAQDLREGAKPTAPRTLAPGATQGTARGAVVALTGPLRVLSAFFGSCCREPVNRSVESESVGSNTCECGGCSPVHTDVAFRYDDSADDFVSRRRGDGDE